MKLGARTTFDLLRSGVASPRSRAEVLAEFVQHASDGTFTVPVARIFPIDDWKAALDASLKGSARGKLVLLCGES